MTCQTIITVHADKRWTFAT